MKRMHIHVSVEDLSKSIVFYSAMFDAEPTVIKDDYAKWMLEDPRVNFAITPSKRTSGVDHLGIQVENNDELTEMHDRLEKAEADIAAQTGAACCYAKSDKYWANDPQGIAWETFHSLGTVPVYGNDLAPDKIEKLSNAEKSTGGSCCS